ncbi:MAG: leucine-rich repeat domain-containing protein [Prevotellaceae bacterium]|nr:leucine-rich repeat domain-containing protein [Prevotellaceae bacterium]
MKGNGLIIAALLVCMATTQTRAHDFTVMVGGQKLYINITSKKNHTAEVTYKGSIADSARNETKGIVEIPAKVQHDSVVYDITAIGAKAFSQATELEGVVIPTSVKTIGDFAFEGCTNLKKVVFPAAEVKMGQGTFFLCKSLKDLSFGSDWKSIDFTAFRWSDSLESVSIPAKVESLRNLKKLAHLTSVELDANNPKFSSRDGVLYNKTGNVLYGVPRAYSGALRIADGTESVTPKALVDCPLITSIYIPETVKTMSFRETARMTQLETIVFRSATPITTAYQTDGNEVLLLQVANQGVKILVPKDAKEAYAKKLTQEAGEYSEKTGDDAVRYTVEETALPKTKNIKELKNFDDYE